jgi:hypothetical protein
VTSTVFGIHQLVASKVRNARLVMTCASVSKVTVTVSFGPGAAVSATE